MGSICNYHASMIRIESLEAAAASFKGSEPFDHVVIDDFLDEEVALKLEAEFPSFESPMWRGYNNPIEVKKLLNDWDKFGEATYRFFSLANSPEFVNLLSGLFGISPLYADPGLHGGGWHIHSAGGKLNAHLDYSIHPKLRLQRKLNLLVYVNSSWEPQWGGRLGLWEQHAEEKKPGRLMKQIEPRFNRAVLFDTTQNSWHGLPDPISCPESQFRKSLAIYYLTEPSSDADERGKALFAPTPEQEEDEAVLNLIKARSQVGSARSVYETAGAAVTRA